MKLHIDAARGGNEMKYVGLVREERLPEIRAALESQIYEWWDGSADAPPKERPPVRVAELDAESIGLSILAMRAGKPIFPLEVILKRFPDDAEERKKVNELRTAFEAEYGAEAVQTGSAAQPNPGAARASALCDYSIDEGLTPLDTTRHVDLASVPCADFAEQRHGSSVYYDVDSSNFSARLV